MGLAGILMYPSIHVVRFYFAAEYFTAKAPDIESSLTSAVKRSEGKRLVCLRDVVVDGGVTPNAVEAAEGTILRALRTFGEGLTDEVYEVLRWELGIARGIRGLVGAWNEAFEYVGPHNAFEELCNMPRNLLGDLAQEYEANRTPEEIAAAEREGEPKLRAHVARLEEFRAMFAQARATHESRKWPLRITAWADILLEVAGIALAFMVMRASLKRR
jgi:hypothetical protein